MDVGSYYKKAIIYPALIAILLSIIFSIIDNMGYKSEWLTAGGVAFLSIIYSIAYCFSIATLSTTIFLNNIPLISGNKIFSFLSWLLMPMSLMSFIIIHEIKLYIEYPTDLGEEVINLLILNLPFIVGLIWSYSKFVQEKRKLVI